MRTCGHLVLTGKIRVSLWDKTKTIPERAPCGKPAVQHVIIYSEYDDYDDDDMHCFNCADHSETFTESENTRIFPINN